MQLSPLLNESQSSVWTALEDPYHAPSHVEDEDNDAPSRRVKSRRNGWTAGMSSGL